MGLRQDKLPEEICVSLTIGNLFLKEIACSVKKTFTTAR